MLIQTCLQDSCQRLHRLEMDIDWQCDRPDSRCISPCKLICNTEVPEGRKGGGTVPLMLLIRSALWLVFLKLFISFCLNLSFLFFCGPHYWLLNFPLTSNSWSSNSTSASAGVPSPTIPWSPLTETMAGEPCKLVQPYSSHQPTTRSHRGQNQRERPLKYNHVYNEVLWKTISIYTKGE